MALFTTDSSGRIKFAGTGSGLSDPGANGIVARTGFDIATARTITAGSTKLTITNGDGASGNPTIDLGTLVAGDIPNLDTSKLTTGTLPLARGGTNADLSATGGSGKYLRQNSVGASVDVVALSASDLPTIALSKGGTNADLSATGGTSQVLKQSSSGAAITVGTLASSNLSDTSNIPLLNANNHFTGAGDQVLDGNLKPATTQVFSWNTKATNTVFQAASDGLVVGFVACIGAGSGAQILSDTSNPPTTVRQDVRSDTAADSPKRPLCCPVRKGDFYKITTFNAPTVTVWWVPFGTAG